MSFMFYDEYEEYLENKYQDYDSDGGMFSNHFDWEESYEYDEEEYRKYCEYKNNR